MGKILFNETKLLLFPNNIPFFSDVQRIYPKKFKYVITSWLIATAFIF